MRHATFTVPGVPGTKGSTRSFRSAGTGKIVTISDNARLKCWTAAVRLAAAKAWKAASNGATTSPTLRPVVLTTTYHLPRPKAHYGTGRNAGRLKDSAPTFPTTKPDLDKLDRAIGDSLTQLVYVDDAQVVDCNSRKRYADDTTPGVTVEVCEL